MDNSIQKTIDISSRKKIEENINENYFVEAGAGSGKTTILVKRMVKMIEEGRDISHICAITFTKAAANEFYERFQKKLIEKSLEKDNPNKDKYLEALQNIDLAFMGTIDSFCNTIMSEHPNEGLIPSNSSVIDDEQAQQIYKREYVNIQNGFYKDAILEDKAKTFLQYDSHPEETFILTLNSLLSHRDCKMMIPNYSKDNLDDKYKDEINTVRKIVKALNNNPNFFDCKNEDINNELISNFKRFEKTFNSSWYSVPNILYAYSKTFGHKELRLNIDKLVETTLQEGIDYFVVCGVRKQYYGINPDKLPKIFEEIEENRYAIILDFVNEAKDKILAKLRKEGLLTFNDYLVYLRDTLRNDAKKEGRLIKHIYERHKYFLIDEFQDTDPIQAEIFFYLAAENIKPHWKECIPYKGSLFVVGDPKQSIYRFKNADVASYLRVKNMFENPNIGEVLYLYENFRSTYEIKSWFNDTFSNLLKDSDDQARFENIPVNEADKKEGISNIYKYDVPYNAKEESDKDEYKARNLILKLYKNDNYKISDKRKENGKDVYFTRTIDWSDFMLITPSKQSLARYTKAFREVGIPYYVEGNIVFKESKAFEMLVNLFGAAVNPNDNRYLYYTLKSRLFNITEKELSEVFNNGALNILADINNVSVSESLKNAFEIIKKYAQCSKLLNPSSLFSKLINEANVFAKLGNENMEYVFFALELLKAKELSKEVVTHEDALAYFEKLLYENNNQERCPGLRKDGNQVHLANLHKVKGLEAPIVILACPTSKKREASFRMVRKDEGNYGYLFNIKKRTKKGERTVVSTSRYDVPYKSDEEESAKAEKLRLEYVAATRAKNILIISNCMTSKGPSDANPWIDLLTTNSSDKLNNIELVLATEELKANSQKHLNNNDIEKSENILEINKEYLYKKDFSVNNPSKLTSVPPKEYEEIDQITQNQLLENTGETFSTAIGTMVHRLMEIIIISRDRINKQVAIDSVISDYVSNELLDSKEYITTILNNVYDKMHNGGYSQNGDVVQDILPVLLNADNLYSEVPFTYKDNKNIWNGIIDVVYEKDGELHIIDWKTNKNGNNLDEHYHQQLEAYKKACKEITGLDVKDATIYHIDILNNES